MFTFANRATGQPWLTELLCVGCPLPSLNAPPSSYVALPPIMSSYFQNSGVFDWYATSRNCVVIFPFFTSQNVWPLNWKL